jgi:adenylylsulfate kinase-like enzyme
MSVSQVIWITGLSGAGKSTLARTVVARLKAVGEPVVMLDGDELREVLGATSEGDANHGRAARLALALRYARLCALLARQGVTVVMATISLFREVHAWNRANLPGYLEVFLRVPTEELRRRDTKGLYARHDRGEIRNVAGLDLAVDEPECPHVTLEYHHAETPDAWADRVMSALAKGTRP